MGGALRRRSGLFHLAFSAREVADGWHLGYLASCPEYYVDRRMPLPWVDMDANGSARLDPLVVLTSELLEWLVTWSDRRWLASGVAGLEAFHDLTGHPEATSGPPAASATLLCGTLREDSDITGPPLEPTTVCVTPDRMLISTNGPFADLFELLARSFTLDPEIHQWSVSYLNVLWRLLPEDVQASVSRNRLAQQLRDFGLSRQRNEHGR
jgi:hypothetical protein